jgi:hypothetical protein
MIIQGVSLNGIRVVDASIITQNLAIWIDANNSSSYSGTGTAITDLSGNSRTQNLASASQYTMLNGVKCFDCNSNSITAASIAPTLPTTGFTYIAWARMKSSSADWRTLYRHNPNDHAILIEVGTNRLGMYDNTVNTFFPSGYNDVSSLADVWVQWTVTGDSSGQIFYINGQQVGTTTQTAAGNSHWYLGGIGATQNFGYIANMELYTAILTQEQILQNYYNQLSRFSLPNIVTSNLILWYDPNFSTSYPGTGTAITNLASTSLAGSMSNITYTSPYFTYNGTSSTMSVADNALLEPGTGDFTLETWVYYSAFAGSSRVIAGKTDGGNAADWSYGIRTQSNGSTYMEVGNGTTTVTTPTYTVSTGQWYQIVGVWTNVASNSIALYVNGVSVGSNSHSFASVKNSTHPLYFGSFDGGATFGQWFNGRMGITRMYSSALTASQILQNYNADKATYGL